MLEKHDHTGRDSLLIANALALTVATYERMPRVLRPHSNEADTLSLLYASVSKAQAERHLENARELLRNADSDVHFIEA